MLLYTPLPLELVWEEEKVPVQCLCFLKGVPVLVEVTGPGEGKIVRVLATDPFSFLDAALTPGQKVWLREGE
ncbi:hypothetical protein Adeg_1265 [Ammonifex degensii KC4]|uniref:Uncharacterized protein n=1 Tax=Ammonifex degensii (strain DSM 10501 / KC4) TaxID=429009 RepID=C9R7U6_AMMDK|nr:YlzJ-like family protein [Ammonifex degensii]ACX52375.1 hypothetical protein Adeg_1265 [Ammonifex degensii KC4]